MKKTDIAMIILIASISIFVAFAIANAIPALKVSDMKNTNVPKIIEIDPNVAQVDRNLFSDSAINPTQQTIIGSKQ